jgi:hypothetical protein
VLAVCDVTDPPSWLKRDTPASFEYRALRRSEFRGFRRVDQGLVSEVSILSPGVRPKEPAAKVLTLRPSNTAGEVIRGGRFIHRYFESPITVR